jgi:hypothetical protein
MLNLKPKIICLTPVRNEAWILDRFLKAASIWADYIIIADQMSTDGSREIALKYSNVILIDNNTNQYNEADRQKLLINEARKIEGPKLLITLDADEFFTPNILESKEWKNIMNSKPGTIFTFQWANITPDFKRFWYGFYFPWGYMDDGEEHKDNNKIHSGRVPLPDNHPVVEIESIKVMHFQYTDWKRMESKHRWYQCMEVVNDDSRSSLKIFRQYHHMFAIPKESLINLPKDWIGGYIEKGINLIIKNSFDKYWFDDEVLDLFSEYGFSKFRKIAIWDAKWKRMIRKSQYSGGLKYKDPRKFLDKIIQRWMFFSQSKMHIKFFRRVDRLIIRFFNY